MTSTHERGDMLSELSAWLGDIAWPAVLLGTGVPVVPSASLTFAPFVTTAYVRAANNDLCYVHQEAAILGPLDAGDGRYWLGVHRDPWTPIPGWTRQVGTQYCWTRSPTLPADPPEGLIFAQVAVTGGVISSVYPIAYTAVVRDSQQWVLGGGIDAVSNTATETTLCSEGITAYRVPPNGTVRIRIWGRYLNNSGSDTTLTLRVYGGVDGTTLQGAALVLTVPPSANPALCRLEVDITNRDDRAVNVVSKLGMVQPASGVGIWGGGSDATTLDFAAPLILAVSAQHETAASTITLTNLIYQLEVIGLEAA